MNTKHSKSPSLGSTRGRLPQRAGLPGLNGGGAAAAAPLTSVDAGKYTTEDTLKTDTLQKLNTTQKKQTTQNTSEQN